MKLQKVAASIFIFLMMGSSAHADMCLDLFAPLGRALGSNSVIALVFNSKAGRAELHLGYVTGRSGSKPTDLIDLNVATGILTFENRAIFNPIDPFLAHAKVMDPRDTSKRIEDRIVTIVGMRTSPSTWDSAVPAHEFAGQLENGTLVRIIELIDNRE